MKRPLTLEDTYQLKSITSPSVSPDGSWVAYIQSENIRGVDGSTQNLWIVSTQDEEAHRLTRYRAHDAQPRWSPDGRYLAFLSDRANELELVQDADWEKGDEEQSKHPQLWVFDRQVGGEPRQLTRRDEGVSHFDWSPDSSEIVFASRDPSEDEASYLKAIRDPKKPGPTVIDRVQHKHDGDGYLDNVKTHLFVLKVHDRAQRRLTDGPASEHRPLWSPDGKWIVFSSNRTGDPDNNQRIDLWLIRSDGTETLRLTQGDVAGLDYQFAPDGQKIALITPFVPENGYGLARLCVVNVKDAVPVASWPDNLGDGWSSIGGIVSDEVQGDPVAHARVYPKPTSATPMTVISQAFDGTLGGIVGWTDQTTVLALAHHRAQQHLVQFGLDGTFTHIMPNERVGTVLAADFSGSMTALVYNRPEHGGEVYIAENLTAFRRRTHSGAWLDERIRGDYHWIQFSNSDGQSIEGIVLAPPGFSPGKSKAPVIVNIHGGPMWYDTPQFEFDTHYWAGRGYLVLMVNYRGSISYGERFCQVIQGDWGPREHDDVMSGVDYLISRGWTDAHQLFCTGFSQGGIMTNWAVGHTNRFRAAVSEHGMWDYISAFGTDDCHLWWQDDLGVPWQNAEAYMRISPMSGLANIHTPLLITAGEHDWRCPLDQAEALYVALKKRGVPTELVIYPGEHHAVTRPSRAIDRLERIDRWLARYGGIPVQSE